MFNLAHTTKVSLKEAKMWATPKTSSPSRALGPRLVTSALGARTLGAYVSWTALYHSDKVSFFKNENGFVSRLFSRANQNHSNSPLQIPNFVPLDATTRA